MIKFKRMEFKRKEEENKLLEQHSENYLVL